MSQSERIVGVGIALVDEKINTPSTDLPTNENLIPFLDTQTPFAITAGGITPNILTALTAFTPDQHVRLLASVGDDDRGEFYRESTEGSLGNLQVIPQEATGVVLEVLDESGQVVDFRWRYGAAESLEVADHELAKQNTLLITDLTVLRLPRMFVEANKMLNAVNKNRGKFYLNLVGLNPMIETREKMISILDSLTKQPDIVMGNIGEFEYLLGQPLINNISDPEFNQTINDVLFQNMFPGTKLVVMTLGEQGAIVRFDGQISHIQSYTVQPQEFVDSTGAGDAFAGIMLGALYLKPYEAWTKEDVMNASDAASFGASLLVKNTDSRLSTSDMLTVQNHYLQRIST